ncbi:hypothetical protein TGAMA5MH_04660 [Trichoderma gamsii]|uniref:Zn(2)-C6 fungal-type domain-containing protein n=1 Tax=Trichoderma gamsii TaxID=398673 RepID=A0A2K0TDT6_9HYPO|nr:hypothetical protein TGAMA5MH_04660 [Trichoderma gamsii]
MEINLPNPSRLERRKLRRGTTSCWECKRRKTKCHFEQGSSAACESCQRRGCKCVLQDVDEKSFTGQRAQNRNLGAQMDYLETVVDQLVHLPDRTSTQDRNIETGLEETTAIRDQGNSSARTAPRRQNTGRQPLQSSNSRRRLLPKLDKASTKEHTPANDLNAVTQPLQPLTSQQHSRHLRPLLLPPSPTSGSPRRNSLILLLQSILPAANVTSRIMQQNKLLMMSMHVFRGLSTDLLRLSYQRQVAYFSSLTLSDAHPIDLARSLFQLAICLQQSDRFPETSKLWLNHSNRDVADQYFEAATRYVTSQDSIVASYEGIETLMLEGLYHVSCGRLQLAWVVFRRALGIAHLVGLHIPQRRRQGKQQTSTSPSSMCLATLWFRLVFMDRYLSLVLDLPMSVLDDSFMDDIVTQAPFEKLERAQAKLTSRIIFRNQQLRLGQRGGDPVYDHYKETKDIDYLLTQATRVLPLEWWIFPPTQDARSIDELRDMIAKIVHQLHHYNFVLLLHIPYILPGPEGRFNNSTQDYSNSKIAAMTAARELLGRSIVPVGPNRVSFSTRGIVLKVLLSALTLLVVHLDGHRLGRENPLGHQRPGDLATAERAIQSLVTMGQKFDDKLCNSAARALKRISALEATAADGVSYTTWSEPGDMVCTECIVQEEANEVQMTFPHVGIIHILRREPHDNMTTAVGLRTLSETGNLDDNLLTPSWALTDSPLSSWPDPASASSNADDVGYLPIGMEIFGADIQEAWNLHKNDVEAIEIPATLQPALQDHQVQEWESNDQRSLLLEETFNATKFGS